MLKKIAPLSLLALTTCNTQKETRPNFLIIMADDCSLRDMELYGGQAKTPNINALATEGVKFNNCFQATAMSAPTRQNLLTGKYPVKTGALANHSQVEPHIKSIVQYLKPLGYKMWFSGKRHIGPRSVFNFDYLNKKGEPPAHKIDSVLKIAQNTQQPFCLYAMCHSPHAPFTEGDPSLYPHNSITLPHYWVDTKLTRETFAKYLAEISYFDTQVGTFIALLEKNGLKENTMVIVLSEQGSLFPFEKWTCYDNGLRSGMVIRYPNTIEAGIENNALVEYSDIVPTMIDFAGGKIDPELDGLSMKNLLLNKGKSHKKYVFGIQTTKGINLSEQPYGIRSVRSAKYKYIRNLFPENEFQNAVLADSSFWNEHQKSYLMWMTSWKNQAKTDTNARAIINRYKKRPAEELYDIINDPHELNNLANNPKFKETKLALLAILEQWMQDQGDAGRDTELHAKIKGDHR